MVPKAVQELERTRHKRGQGQGQGQGQIRGPGQGQNHKLLFILFLEMNKNILSVNRLFCRLRCVTRRDLRVFADSFH